MKKYYFVEFSYDDPYPKNFKVTAQEATGIGRAVDKAYREFKKTRRGKREPIVLKVLVGRI